MNNFAKIRRLLISLGTLSLVLSAHGQGPLNPAGPPGPMMKTLQQVEPRTDLATVAGNADYHHVISSPGSYYLSAPLNVTKPHGIVVQSVGVTIDLGGFPIRRAAGSAGNAIQIDAAAEGCRIRSGTINGGFTHAVSASGRGGSIEDVAISGCLGSGISVAQDWRVERVEAFGNGGNGISVAQGSVVANCTASRNTGRGIFVGAGSTVTHCAARENGEHGFVISSGSAVTNSTAHRNGGDGFNGGSGSCSFTNCSALENKGAYGIETGGNSTVAHCTASDNVSTADSSAGIFVGGNSTVTHCTASGNKNTGGVTSERGVGIWGSGGVIQNCTVSFNQGDGIRVGVNSRVSDNNAVGNGSNGFGSGVHATAYSNRIEGNNVIENDRGIRVEGGGNLIVRNSARLNTSNYDIAANNRYGVILDLTATGSAAGSGDSAAGTLTTTTNPWANFSY